MSKNTQNIEILAVDSLVPYKNNARTHSQEQVDKIVKSLKEFGFINPVLINKENVIIAGHGRVMAAKQLGLKDVPCLRIEHLSEEQMRAYVIADNKLAEDAGWDEELLKSELQDLFELDFDISLTGFDMNFFEDVNPVEVVEDNYVESEDIPPRAKRGDVYQLGDHKLMCGDSTSVADLQILLGGGAL